MKKRPDDLEDAFPEIQAFAQAMKDHPTHGNKNPMVRKWGLGPAGKKCLACKLGGFQRGGSKKFYKCQLRGLTHGQATDHSSRFDACSKFQVDIGYEILDEGQG